MEPIKPYEREVFLAQTWQFSSLRKHRAVCIPVAQKQGHEAAHLPQTELPLALKKWVTNNTVFFQLEQCRLAVGE